VQARKKLNLLNTVTFEDIQSAIISLAGYVELGKNATTDEKGREYLERGESLTQKIASSLAYAKNYQDMGMNPSRWQNVHQTFLFAISHLDFSRIDRKISLNGLEIYADPLLEKVFLTLAENVIGHGETATEIVLRYCETQEGLTLVFEDNGVGVPDAVKEKIFGKGYGEKKGMNLFLICEILSITGITIKETGTFGKGARFEINIPKGAYRFAH
jgi:signal transduction histidine kinase